MEMPRSPRRLPAVRLKRDGRPSPEVQEAGTCAPNRQARGVQEALGSALERVTLSQAKVHPPRL